MDASASSRPSRLRRTVAAVIRWALSRRIVRALLLYAERRGPMLADAVTYRALFSVFAALLLGFSVAGLWLSGDSATLAAVTRAIDAAVPGLMDLVDLDAIPTRTGLSVAGVISLVGLVGAALGAIGSLRTALRTIAGTVHDDVLWIRVILRNLLLAVVIAAAFVASAALTFAGRFLVSALSDALGIADGSPLAFWGVRLVSLVAVLLLDAVLIAVAFRVLSGVRARLRLLLPGTLLGAVALLVLQELSGLFVGGAASNPLLASFASLLALLIWMNLSTQVILVAAAFIVTAVDEDRDRVAARHGAQTFAQRRVQQAEHDVRIAVTALHSARDAEASERAERADAPAERP